MSEESRGKGRHSRSCAAPLVGFLFASCGVVGSRRTDGQTAIRFLKTSSLTDSRNAISS